MDIVEKSGGQYHVLVIIADGQVESSALSSPKHYLFINVLISFTVKVTRSVNTGDGELSSQEQKTIKSIVAAR